MLEHFPNNLASQLTRHGTVHSGYHVEAPVQANSRDTRNPYGWGVTYGPGVTQGPWPADATQEWHAGTWPQGTYIGTYVEEPDWESEAGADSDTASDSGGITSFTLTFRRTHLHP